MTINNAFLYRMPAGIPGAISRSQNVDVASFPANPAAAFAAYGLLGKLLSGKFVPITAGDTAGYGILTRPFPIGGVNASDALGVSVPPNVGMLSPLRRGHMTVLLNAGSAVAGGPVYVRNGNPSGAKVIGGFEATTEAVGAATGGNTGNGTITAAPTTGASTKAGTYTVTMKTATTFGVTNPQGDALKDGVTGAAYTAEGLTFTVTVGGTPMVAGDSFTVTQNTFPLANATFMGPADASGNVEIAYNI
jgi:hypothetical protein